MARFEGFRGFDEAFAWLASHTNYETMATQRYDERTYGLARVERLVAEVGRPDLGMEIAQVVGSKGKGSAATMLAAMLRASGRRTGLFTSPHLVDPRERITVDGVAVQDAVFCRALGRLVGPVDAARARGEPCTFFEIHTVAALLALREAGCDAAVLEAGMGGRLDATSAATARVKLLTSVSLDHVAQLGRTLVAVAREKAHCARSGVLLVSGEPLSGSAGREVARVAGAAGAPLRARGRDFRVSKVRTSLDPATGATSTVLRLHDGDLRLDLGTPLFGAHQASNAAVAAVAALHGGWTGPAVTVEHVVRGLAAARIRARLEVVGLEPLTLVDGAHSPVSMARLADTVRDALRGRRVVFVVGMAADKDVGGSLRALRGVAARVVATSSGQPRAAPPDAIAASARRAGIDAVAAPDVRSALAIARADATVRGAVVVTGSLYLCGAALRGTGSA